MSAADFADRRPTTAVGGPIARQEPGSLDLRAYFGAAARHSWLIALVTLSALLVTAALALLLPRPYEATTRLLLDPRALQVVERDATPRANTTDQTITIVESEMRVLSSDRILLPVIDKLALANDPDFNGEKRVPWSFVLDAIDQARGRIRAWLKAPATPASSNYATLQSLQQAVKVRREPLSFAIDLAVTSSDPEKSAKIANAIAAEYLVSHVNTQSSATQKASDTLTGRLEELRRRAEAADAAVARYKSDNDIVGASGHLVNEQQLTEIGTQLSVARAETSKAKARLEQIRALRQSGINLDTTREAVLSETVRNLRNQYAQIRQREAALSTTVLPGHPLYKQVHQELADVRRLIDDEVGRIAEAARLDLDRARTNEQTIEKRWTALKTQEGDTNAKMVRLRELEREAESSSSIYASTLVRSRELGEQKQLDTSLATVISPAVPPKSPGGVPLGLILAAGGLLGLSLGIASALARDSRDPVLRSPDQIKAGGAFLPVTLVPPLGTAFSSGRGIFAKSRPDAGAATKIGGLLDPFVISAPNSPPSRAVMGLMSETLASAGQQGPCILFVTSVNPTECKLAIALNMALAAMRSGERVLLVDGDAETHKLTELIVASDLPGLVDVIDGSVLPGAATITVPEYSLDIMPLGRVAKRAASRSMRSFDKAIRALAEPYDLVVINGGVLPYGEFAAILHRLATRTVVVVQQGTTDRTILEATLSGAAPAQYAKTRIAYVSRS